MNNEKLIAFLDGMAKLCAKAFILFKVLDMFLTAIGIWEPIYRFLSVLIDCIIIALIIYFINKSEDEEKTENLLNKKVLINGLFAYLKVYAKVVFYSTIVLIVLGIIIDYK